MYVRTKPIASLCRISLACLFGLCSVPSWAKAETTLQTLPLITRECDGQIADCWTIDIPEQDQTPLECAWQFLELVRQTARDCAPGEQELRSYLDASIGELGLVVAKSRQQPFTPADLESEAALKLSPEFPNVRERSLEQLKQICTKGKWPSWRERVVALERVDIHASHGLENLIQTPFLWKES